MIDIKNLKCHYCNKAYTTIGDLKRHCRDVVAHLKKVEESGIPQDIDAIKAPKNESKIAEKNRETRNSKMTINNGICKVPLYDNHYVLVNDFIWNKISMYTIVCNNQNIQITVNGKRYLINRYIYYNLYHNPARFGKYYVAHTNNDFSDATIENLIELTPEECIRKKSKTNQPNTTYIQRSIF